MIVQAEHDNAAVTPQQRRVLPAAGDLHDLRGGVEGILGITTGQ